MVGVFLSVDDSQLLTASEYMTRRGTNNSSYLCVSSSSPCCHFFILFFMPIIDYAAKEAVGAEETPNGWWSVTRLRSAAHGTLNMPGLSLAIGPKGGLGELGDAVALQLILTKASLVERRIDNYEVSWQHVFRHNFYCFCVWFY